MEEGIGRGGPGEVENKNEEGDILKGDREGIYVEGESEVEGGAGSTSNSPRQPRDAAPRAEEEKARQGGSGPQAENVSERKPVYVGQPIYNQPGNVSSPVYLTQGTYPPPQPSPIVHPLYLTHTSLLLLQLYIHILQIYYTASKTTALTSFTLSST